ncbi:formylglycine-generating enzyme family protein, partial [Cylindrospermopsis raciborskii]
YTLPSEAQWEYACRAGTITPFHFGGSINTDLANYNGNYTQGSVTKGEWRQQTTEVGIFPPNAFGLYDMHGNVCEWCLDTWHRNYQGAPNDGSPWIDESSQYKVIRGGSWINLNRICRCASRDFNFDYYNDHYGFRVVCNV